MKTFKFILAVSFFFVVHFGVSQAAIDFVDASGSAVTGNGITQMNISPTSGPEGEFEILACVTGSTGSNFFTNAEVDWNNFNLGNCGGPNCTMGIFTKLSPMENNLNSTCFWDEGTFTAAGAVLRYSGVRTIGPVADFDCNMGIGNTATTPSINAPEGSMVVRIYGSNGSFSDIQGLPGSRDFGRSIIEAEFNEFDAMSSLFVYGEPFADGGIAGEVSIQYELVDTAWRACAISLIMEGTPLARAIPTMSEWGMIAFVVIAGVAAVLVLRRRSVRA